VNKDGSNDGPTSGSLEHKHDYVHMFVGGTMSNPTTAPNDPTFYFYHTYIDYVVFYLFANREK
jgi:hypothetical protein